jgi:oxygen-independent coproporphyrinogen III oxidase
LSEGEVKGTRKPWNSGEALPADGRVEALYVHVPFCLRKCEYCDFYSLAGASLQAMSEYVDAALCEARLWREQLENAQLDIRTVFIGGGTPTLLPMSLMRRLLAGLRRALPLDGVDEWTVEANPATVDADCCRMLLDEGVTRLSVGVQSLDDAELRVLGRTHTAAEAQRTVATARAAGFWRLSVDLIYGIPGQTEAAWRMNLERVLEMGLTHISCYGLTYEEGTPLERRRRCGGVQSVSEAEDLSLFRLTGAVLERAGRRRYEVSNYAVIGEECRHNLTYWSGGDYIGIGPAAASHLAGCRWHAPRNTKRWQEVADSRTFIVEDFERLSVEQRAAELAMLMLRMTGGLRYDMFALRLRQDARKVFAEQLQRLAKAGLIRLNLDGAALTDRGMEIADTVSLEFFA